MDMTVNRAGRRYLALLGVSAGVITGFGGTAAVQASRARPASLTAHLAGTIAPGLNYTIPTPFTLFKGSNPAANGGHPGSYAWGVATMPDGTIAVGDIFNNRVLHYDNSGNLLGILFQTNGKSGANPYGLAVDPNDGTIYVGTLGGVLLAIDDKSCVGGGFCKKWKFPAGVGIGSSPAIGADGTIYFMAGGQVFALH